MQVNNSMMITILAQFKWLQELFQGMPTHLLDKWHKISYESGESLVEQGETAEFLYILLEGEFKVQFNMSDGSEFGMARMYAGELVSDIELALECPYLYRVEALSKGSAIALKANLYKAWIKQDPHFLMYLNTKMARKLYESSQKTIRVKKGSIRLHILRLISNWTAAHDYHQKSVYTRYFSMEERKELASSLGVHIRSILRVLKDLEGQEVFRLSRGRIMIDAVQNIRVQKLMDDESVW
jgi:CRP/FNR family cyclic AMP-dependent transcriptional regulator